MREMTNKQRALVAAEAVDAYEKAGGYAYGETHPAELLGDLLGDLRHWADREGADYILCANNARTCYEDESGEEISQPDPEAEREYLVVWEIDAYATSPREAARQVIDQYFGAIGTADHFTVTDQETGETFEIDAFDDDDDEDGQDLCDQCGRSGAEIVATDANGKTTCIDCEGDDAGKECTCADRSWHGPQHDSACDFAGEDRV